MAWHIIREKVRRYYINLEKKVLLTPQRAIELRKLFDHHEFPWTSQEKDAYERLYAIALTEIAFTASFLLWGRDVLPGGFGESA